MRRLPLLAGLLLLTACSVGAVRCVRPEADGGCLDHELCAWSCPDGETEIDRHAAGTCPGERLAALCQ